MPMPEVRFAGAMMTDVLVGRKRELDAIQRATSTVVGDTFQLVLFIAKGGIGKTRLLHEAAKRLGAQGHLELDGELQPFDVVTWERPDVVCLSLIDLADPKLHDQISFLRQVRQNLEQALPTEAQQYFHSFDVEMEAYQISRDQGRSYGEIQALRARVLSAFAKNYAELTQHYRVIWLLDTLEQLFAVAPGIEQLLRDVNIAKEEIGQTTYNWLMEFIERRPAHTTLLMSGRPTPSRWYEDIRQMSRLAGDRLAVFILKPFTWEETESYFAILSNQLTYSSPKIANYLRYMLRFPERVRVMHALTDGNPILLALYIDMIANVDEEPEEFNISYEEWSQLGSRRKGNLRRAIESRLLDYIESGVTYPENRVLLYLFVTRRGLNAQRLASILGNTVEESQELLDRLRRLSFVKGRVSKIFLHDELYDMYARRLQSMAHTQREAELAEIQRTFTTLIAHLRYRLQETNAEIARLGQRDPVTDPLTDEERIRLRSRRHARRRYQAEQLHYQLYLDPFTGFNEHYYVLAEQAIIGFDPELDAFIQSELELFFFGTTSTLSQELSGIDEEQWNALQIAVREEQASRWIKRLWQYNKPRRAQHFAQGLLQRYNAITGAEQPNELFKATVQAYWCFAAIWQGLHPKQAIEQLERVIGHIETYLRLGFRHPSVKLRYLNIAAQCYAENGYGYATRGRFGEAIERYIKAGKILSRTGHQALNAEVKNNLSRVIGELGDFARAEGMCEEGLEIRKQLGFDYSVGLSFNTLSLIRTRNHRPASALAPAEEARRIFTQLGSPRGVVLAGIQLAEAKRHSFNLAPTVERLHVLDEALLLLEEVEALFAQKIIQETAREILAKIERGCLERDWASFLFGQQDAVDAFESHFAQARIYLAQARLLAQDSQFEQLALDAAVNEAYLYYYCSMSMDAEAMIQTAMARVPLQYILGSGHFDLAAADNVAIFMQLSKLCALRAAILDAQEQSSSMKAHEQFALCLRYAVEAVTYGQLFSSAATAASIEHYYLGENKKHLRKLIGRIPDRIPLALEIVRGIVEGHELQALLAPGERLQVDIVAEEYKVDIAAADGIDYLG